MIATTEPLRCEIGSDLSFVVEDQVSMALLVAAASTAGHREGERLEVALDGRPLDAREVAGEHGVRIHVIRSGAGELTVHYRAVVSRGPGVGARPAEFDRVVALRQSRYCPSDLLVPFAEAELATQPDGAAVGLSIGAWVHSRLRYETGTSGPSDTAIDTLLAGRGVCRDFAHLTIALCRAAGIPARLVAVYAPGLSPMDFHAVAEVAAPDGWQIVDATRLAPRPSLVRIATGRDAADTAFSTTLAGAAELTSSEVTAVVVGDLPDDDHRRPVSIA